MPKTLNELIADCLEIGQEVGVSLYNNGRLVMLIRGRLKREQDNGQFYIRDDNLGLFFIFTDTGYFDYKISPMTRQIQLIQLYIDSKGQDNA